MFSIFNKVKSLRVLTRTFLFVSFLSQLILNESFAQTLDAHGLAPKTSTSQNDSVAPADCPTALFEQVRNGDKQGGWLGFWGGSTVNDACKNKLISSLDSPSEFENILSSNESFQLGPERPAGFLDKCLAKYTHRPEKCRGPNCDTTMQSKDQSAAIADYYFSMNQLKMGVSSNYEAIAGIDRILGTPHLKNVRAMRNSEIPGARDAFNELNNNSNCRKKDPHALDDMVSQFPDSYTALTGIRAKIAANQINANPNCTSRGGAKCRTKAKDKELQMKLEAAERAIVSSFPWLVSPAFTDTLGQHYTSPSGHAGRGKKPENRWTQQRIKEAFVAHFEASRNALVQQNERFYEASNCIHGKDGKSCMPDHSKTMQEAPELDTSSMLKEIRQNASAEGGKLDKKSLDALAEFDTAGCRQDMREIKTETGKIMNDFVLNAGLTAVTFGASAYATAALKGAQLAAGAAKGGANLVNAFQKSSALPKAVRAAAAVAIGADAAWLGPSGADALNTCLGEVEYKLGQDSRQFESTQKVSCSNDSAKQVSAVNDSKNCVLAAALAAVDALPLLPPLAARFQKVEKLLPTEELRAANLDANDADFFADHRVPEKTKTTLSAADDSDEVRRAYGEAVDDSSPQINSNGSSVDAGRSIPQSNETSAQAERIGISEDLLTRAKQNGLSGRMAEHLSSPNGVADTQKYKDAAIANQKAHNIAPNEGILLLEDDADILYAVRKFRENWIATHGEAPIIIAGHGSPSSMAVKGANQDSLVKIPNIQNNVYGGTQLASVLESVGIQTKNKEIFMFSCHGGVSCGLSRVLPERIYSAPYTKEIDYRTGQFIEPSPVKPSKEWEEALDYFDGDIDRAGNLDDENFLFFRDGRLN